MDQVNLPVFHVRDTESSHGRYSDDIKEISFSDLVKFHGHACDGLYRGVYALSAAFKVLLPDGIIDRTDIRALSRNSPCLGDAVSYLTGARVRFGTQDVLNRSGVWYMLQIISTQDSVEVTEDPDFFPSEISDTETSLPGYGGKELSVMLDKLKEMQNRWIEETFLRTKPEEHYYARKIEFKWNEVPYSNKGIRTDILFKDVLR